MRILETFKRDQLIPVLDLQYLGELFLPGMIVIDPNKNHWLSLGCVQQAAVLLWPVTKHRAGMATIFKPVLLHDIDLSRNPHHVPWNWAVIKRIDLWQAVPTDWVCPAHGLLKQQGGGGAAAASSSSSSSSAGAAAGPPDMVGLFAVAKGEACRVITCTAQYGFKNINKEILKNK